jgi:hypothetical protein
MNTSFYFTRNLQRQERSPLGFYRSLSSSKTYNIFKALFSGKVCFTFGVIGEGVHPEHLNNYKLVTDVKFIKAAEVEEKSIEWIAEQVQKQARNKQGLNN